MSSLVVWDDLARAGATGAVTLTRRLHPASQLELHLGLRQPGAHPLLLIDLDRSLVPSRGDLPATRAIIPSAIDLPGGRARLQLGLGDPALRTVFAAFVDDVTGSLAKIGRAHV